MHPCCTHIPSGQVEVVTSAPRAPYWPGWLVEGTAVWPSTGDPGASTYILPSPWPNLPQTAHSLWCRKTVQLQPLHTLQALGSTSEEQVRFILDCISNPTMMQLVQLHGQTVKGVVLYLTRTWAFSIHRQKLILLGRWPPGASQTSPSLPPTSEVPQLSQPNSTSTGVGARL